MMIPMIGLIILVVFMSNSAFDVKNTCTGDISSRGALALLRVNNCWHYDGDIYPSTSNRNDIENEPNEEPEDDLSEKAPSRISNFGRKGIRCINKKDSCGIF